MDVGIVLLSAFLGYITGSISFPRLAVRLFAPEEKKELKDFELDVPGSDRKMVVSAKGASAAPETLGSKAGCAIGLLDMAKVFIPTLLFRLYYPHQSYFLITALAGTIGHCWPLYYRFKGGRGFSTIYGGLLAIDWLGAIVCSIGGWILGLVVFRNFLLVFLSGLWLLIPWMWFMTGNLTYVGYALAVNILFILAMIPELKQYLQFRDQVKNISLSETMITNPMGRAMLRIMNYFRGTHKSKP